MSKSKEYLKVKKELKKELKRQNRLAKKQKGGKHLKVKEKKVIVSKKRGITVLIVATVIAISGLVVSTVYYLTRKNKTVKDISKKNSTVDTVDDLDSMGMELDFAFDDTLDQAKYGEVTGDVDVNKIVTRQESGKTVYYKDEESANKANEVGTVITDTKGDTLKVEKDGTVVEKTEYNEVIDSNTGEVISSGEGSIPSGYTETNEGEYIDNNEISDVVILDTDIWTSDEMLFAKGDCVTRDAYNRIEQGINNGIFFTSNPYANSNSEGSKQYIKR